jgi:hypothetical protein
VWLVICDEHDPDAEWLVAGLGARGARPVEHINARSLVEATRWAWWLDSEGAKWEVTLGDGRNISSSDVLGVVNRLTGIPPNCFGDIRPEDRSYAEQERVAFLMAWLRSLKHVLNPATPAGLCGELRSPSEWRLLACRSGLPVAALRIASSSSDGAEGPVTDPTARALVLARRVLGKDLPVRLHQGCGALAELARTPVLQIDFALDSSGALAFASASPLPQLRWAGAAALDALVAALMAR